MQPTRGKPRVAHQDPPSEPRVMESYTRRDRPQEWKVITIDDRLPFWKRPGKHGNLCFVGSLSGEIGMQACSLAPDGVKPGWCHVTPFTN